MEKTQTLRDYLKLKLSFSAISCQIVYLTAILRTINPADNHK